MSPRQYPAKKGTSADKMANLPHFADGGFIGGMRARMFGPAETVTQKYARQDAERAVKAPAPAPAAAPAPSPAAGLGMISNYAGMTAMQRREKEAGMKDGGAVTGPGTGTSDSVPIMASHGEYMLPADTTKALGGKKVLDKIVDATHTPTGKPAIKRGMMARADGGMVDPIKSNSFGDASASTSNPGTSVVSSAPMAPPAPAPAPSMASPPAMSTNAAAMGSTPAPSSGGGRPVQIVSAMEYKPMMAMPAMRDGGAVDDALKKKNSFGDAAAAMTSPAVAQIPVGGMRRAPAADGSQSNPLNSEIGRNAVNTLSALPGVGGMGMRAGSGVAAKSAGNAIAVERAAPASWELVEQGGAIAGRAGTGANSAERLGGGATGAMSRVGDVATNAGGTARLGLPGPSGQLARTTVGRPGVDMSGTTAPGIPQIGQAASAATDAALGLQMAGPGATQAVSRGLGMGAMGRYAAGAGALGATAALTGATSAASGMPAGAESKEAEKSTLSQAQSSQAAGFDAGAAPSVVRNTGGTGGTAAAPADPNQITVTRQANGVTSFSGGPNIGMNGGANTYVGDAAKRMGGGFGVSTVPGMSRQEIDRTLGGLSASQVSSENAIRAANLRDGVDINRGTAAGQAADAQQRMQALASSPLGTPGRKFAQEQLIASMGDATTRRGQDASTQIAEGRLSAERVNTGIAQRKLGLEESKTATEQAQKDRVAKLDDEIINGNPMQQRAAAAKKAAILGKGVEGGGKMTEDQAKSTGYAVRMEDGLRIINEIGKKNPGATQPDLRTSAVNVLPEPLANALRSEDRQRVESAQLDALDAALTLATGAAYTREQMESLRRSYFAQPNDKPENVADKQERLQKVIETARLRAGPVGAGMADKLKGSPSDKPPSETSSATSTSTQDSARIAEIQRRAAADPALAARLKEAGY